MHTSISPPRRRLARIRCLMECINCMKEKRKLIPSLCYIPSELEFKCQTESKSVVRVYPTPSRKSKKIADLKLTAESRLYVSGDEYCNSQGKWLKLLKYMVSPSDPIEDDPYQGGAWILQYSSKSTDDCPKLVQVMPEKGSKRIKLNSWEDVVEQAFSVQLPGRQLEVVSPDNEAVERLQAVPSGWGIEQDEVLVRLMSQHIPPDNDHLGSIKNYVESVNVSTFCDDDTGPQCLTDSDTDTYWESDGSQGNHWIRLKMKKGTIIMKLQIVLDGSDDNYIPRRIVVSGGEQDNLKVLKTVEIEREFTDVEDFTLLENMTEHISTVQITIKECKGGGIDTRIHALKIQSSEGRYLGFDEDFFKKENLTRFPKLQPYSSEELYRRSQVLQRFTVLLDSVLQYIVPAWEFSTGSYSSLEAVRQLLPLSTKRLSLIDTFIKESCSDRPADMPKLFINRRSAMEHRCDPYADQEFKNSVFMQIYEGLKPKDRDTKPLNYRWSSRYDQWWECKFMSEGVIDQGGGFRDSLSDVADELCPTTTEGPVPLPFFIRAPNQLCEDANVNRDVYVPNPSCREFQKYEWIGQLMGACLRGRENLVLALPSFVWKKLSGERVHWTRDYHTVDATEVKLIDSLENMKEDDFSVLGRTWSTTLCDGSNVVIKMDTEGNPLKLKYDDRKEYCDKVREIRMNEGMEQVDAIRRGFLRVVPQAVLDLLTWQEVEHRVSGDSEISMEALKRSIHYDDLEESDTRVKYMWSALENFSNEDRSRFLRFVTGRRRLPAPVFVSSGKSDAIDCLPESSTCANMLYMPNFTSAKICEDKLRYASYNCVDMDADVNYMDEIE
ncbi:hypothetical protein FSP39_017814 [Pinctada imbricata]|uniref:E3 ubiquitin-protein ligase HECTD3 n=1 Tax=Pinctada imbricata TaxID=66713 RepID=A0AA88XRU5_PINIB|nr:hypothetical protein FSP39_017814 [Pinctada imbricata]